MLGIIAMIALFIGTFVFAVLIEESFNRAIVYATLLTISVSGLFTMGNMILPLPLSIMIVAFFAIMLLRGKDFLESLLTAAFVSRMILIGIGLCTIVLPATLVWLLAQVMNNWGLALIITIPVVSIIGWYVSLEYWPMIKVYVKHTFTL